MGTPYAQMTPEQKSRAHAAKKRWSLKNKEKRSAYRKKHYLENRDKYLDLERDRAYQNRYGISIQDYDMMFAEQGGKCLICKADKACKTGRFRFFSVDHCHTTGAVRGLLCTKCNGALGWYEAYAPEILKYLNR